MAPSCPSTETASTQLNPRIVLGLTLLLQAQDYALEVERDPWDFAIEIQALRMADLTNSDLRWLVCRAYVEHGREITPSGKNRRSFRPTGLLTFTERTCFVLTEKGSANARRATCGVQPEAFNRATAGPETLPLPAMVPRWDHDRQELHFGLRIIKKFKVPAPNQGTVLATFEEDGWPVRIDDPLPPRLEQDPKRRLHDTIYCLNRHHQHPLIRFLGDGRGEGVCWKCLAAGRALSA